MAVYGPCPCCESPRHVRLVRTGHDGLACEYCLSRAAGALAVFAATGAVRVLTYVDPNPTTTYMVDTSLREAELEVDGLVSDHSDIVCQTSRPSGIMQLLVYLVRIWLSLAWRRLRSW